MRSIPVRAGCGQGGTKSAGCKKMAEREGFEPSVHFNGVHSLSRRAPSALLGHLSVVVCAAAGACCRLTVEALFYCFQSVTVSGTVRGMFLSLRQYNKTEHPSIISSAYDPKGLFSGEKGAVRKFRPCFNRGHAFHGFMTSVSGYHGRLRSACHGSCGSNGAHEAGRTGLSPAGNVVGSAVINRCADYGQAQGYVNAVVKMQQFERNKTLVMIHADNHVIVPRAAA